ncbi:aKG-HExxH-type peptide beta-hydroxylase [Streptomyces sp. NRAIS4]
MLDEFDGFPGWSRPALPQAPAAVPLAVPRRNVDSGRLHGREPLVAELTDAVTRRARGEPDIAGVWLLSGMGGCGKTSIAQETAHRLMPELAHVWWVSGVDGDVLSSALHGVASVCGARRDDFSAIHPADVLWRHLDAVTEPWLLVLDNVDDPDLLAAAPSRTADGNGWLREPRHPLGTVLITSRESRPKRWGSLVHQVGVELLSREDSGQVLLDLAPHAGGAEDAEALAEDLGRLPLALALAGSQLRRLLDDPFPAERAPATFQDFRRAFADRLADVGTDPDPDPGPDARSRRTIRSVWDLSLDQLHRQGCDLARPLLRLLCAFGPAPLPYLDLLKLDVLAASPVFIAPTRPRISEALSGLEGLRLITIERSDGTGGPSGTGAHPRITIHPLVRAASATDADTRAQAPALLDLVSALLAEAIGQIQEGNPAHWPRWRALAPHCAAPQALLADCGEAVAGDADRVVRATEPAVRAGRYYDYLGQSGDAVTELRLATDLRTSLLGERNADTLAAGLQLAWSLRGNGDLAESEQRYRHVITIGEQVLPADHRSLQSARSGLARTLRQRGEYQAAEEQLRLSLDMRLRDPQADPRGILRMRHELAKLAHRRGRFHEAVTQLRDIRRQTSALCAEDDWDSLDVGVSLARALRDARLPEEAESVAEEVVRDGLKSLAPDHPNVLMARHERARILRDHEEDPAYLERAKAEFTDIWQSFRDVLGADHPDTITAQHELATVCHLLGQLEPAADHFAAALEAGRRRLGEEHPNVAVCARNLARVRAELATARRTGNPEDPEDETGLPQGDSMGHSSLVTDSEDGSFEQAPAPGHPVERPAAEARLLERFIRSRECRAGSDSPGGDGGFSGGSYVPSEPPRRRAEPKVGGGAALSGRPGHWTYRPRGESAEHPHLFDEPLDATELQPQTLRDVAIGEDGGSLARLLLAQQRRIRVLALNELLRRAEAYETAQSGFPLLIQDIRSLFLQANRADPEAVTTVLLHPGVGRWMSRALRELGPVPDTPTPPPSADLSHVHAVAAAAALRAGLAFTLPLPVRYGMAVLPTLGAADLRSSGTDTAHVTAADGTAVIRGADVEVWLPTPSDSRLRGWLPVHRVRTSGPYGGFDFLLDDLDPHRHPEGPTAPDRLLSATVDRWQDRAQRAGDVLVLANPWLTEALRVTLTAVTPRPRERDGRVMSMSSSDAFGGVVISATDDPADFAVALAHEFRHMKLNAVLDSHDLYSKDGEGGDDGDDTEDGEAPGKGLYYAPWRDDPRPLPGYLHGVYAYFGVVDLWRRLTYGQDPALRRRAQFELVHWRTQTWDAYTVLRASSRLTKEGREFTATMGESAARWAEHTPIPDHLVRLAEEAVIAHRGGWRLHYLSPRADHVGELAEAWVTGTPRPPRRHVGTDFLPRRELPDLTAYRVRLARVAAAVPPSSNASVPCPDRVPHSAYDALDPTDAARLLGRTETAHHLAVDQLARQPGDPERWIRLALTLRGPGSVESLGRETRAAAARALTHRPELVRAVHARVTATTGSAPDPVALAAWLAASEDLGDLPPLPTLPWTNPA